MYFPYFITYITIGLVISLVVFFWALANGQFRDQKRARFLPLHGLAEAPVHIKNTRWGPIEIYALLTLSALGLAATAATLVFALFFT